MVQRLLERDITQTGVQRILRSAQESCRLHFLIVNTTLHAVEVLQGRTGLLDIAEIGGLHLRIEVVGHILRCGDIVGRPGRVLQVALLFTQVGEGHDITGLVIITLAVGDPYLDLVDRHAR